MHSTWIFVNPSQKEIEYYKSKNTEFQIIHVVANIHTFKQEDKSAIAYPYSISVVAGAKRGLPDTCSITFLERIDLDNIDFKKYCYTDFSPFLPADQGFYVPIDFIYGSSNQIRSYTDTIGFILETYFLPTNIELKEALISGPQHINQNIIDKYDKYRIKRYFKPFSKIQPRRIWGCDSPIELFLIQSLAQHNIFPTIQTLIFNNGEVYDNFYEMIEKETFISGSELITEVDLYFPENKLAIFCDSTKYHRSIKAKTKDARITKRLNEIGIKSLRIKGKDIVHNLERTTELIINEIKRKNK